MKYAKFPNKLNEELLNAVKTENVKLVEELLDGGADVNSQVKGYTSLLYATKTGNIEIAKLLIDRGADVNFKNNVTLIYASEIGNLEIINLLLDRGVDVNLQNEKGWSALMHATRYSKSDSNIETVKLLLDRGANVNIKNDNGRTSLMLAAGESRHDSNIETVKLLLDSGAEVNIQDNEGKTALIYSSKLSNNTSSIDTVKLLLDKGADPFIKDNSNKSALEYCPTDECEELLAKYIWKRLYERDMETAKRYGRNLLSKDIWEIILLNKRQQQLCQKLSSEKNKIVLKYFAMELNIPITEDMTKAKLCGLISRYLAYNKYFSEKSKEYTENKIKTDIESIKNVASRFGLDRNRPIEELLKDLALILK